MTWLRSAWVRIRAAALYLARLEPARAIAGWRALMAVAVAIGVTIGADVDARVTGAITALYALLAWAQGESVRSRVTPTARIEAVVRQVAAEPGVTPGAVRDLTDRLL